MVQILLSSACIVQSMINEHEHEQANTTVLHLNYTWVTMMSSESHVVAVSTKLPRGTRDYIHFVSSLSSIYTQSPTTSSPSSTSHIPLRVIDDHISTSIQYQETDTHTSLHYQSPHPSHCKTGLPRSRLQRLRRLCSEDSDFQEKGSHMVSFFEQRRYSQTLLQNDLHAFRRTDRIDASNNHRPSNQRSDRYLG